MAAKVKSEGYRARALPAVVKAMKRSKKPWSRAKIDALKVPGGLGKRSLAGLVNDAQFAGREIDGYRFTRPARGMYGVEKAS